MPVTDFTSELFEATHEFAGSPTLTFVRPAQGGAAEIQIQNVDCIEGDMEVAYEEDPAHLVEQADNVFLVQVFDLVDGSDQIEPDRRKKDYIEHGGETFGVLSCTKPPPGVTYRIYVRRIGS